MRRSLSAVLVLAAGLALSGDAVAASPNEITIGPATTSASWTGFVAGSVIPGSCPAGSLDQTNATCDHLVLNINGGVICSPVAPCNVTVSAAWADNGIDDLDLYVYTCPVVTDVDPGAGVNNKCTGGTQVNFPCTDTSGCAINTSSESVTFSAEANRFEVRVEPFLSLGTDYTGTATFGGGGTGGNGPPPPVDPPVYISDARIVEGDGGTRDAVFTLTMGWESIAPASVTYTTQDATAAGVSDYVPTSGVAVFVPGSRVTTIRVPVVSDFVNENNESFVVNLALGTPAVVKIYDGRGVATIVDDDWRRQIGGNGSITGAGGSNGIFALTITENRWGRLSYRDASVRFYAYRIDSVDFNDLTRTAVVQGRGYKNGQSVSFTLEAVDNGLGILDSFVLTLGDGSRAAGTLKTGNLTYQG